MVEPSVRAALLEDLGRAGDLTTDAIVPASARTECALMARQPGVVAGLDFAAAAFRLIDPAIEVLVERADGSRLAPGDLIAMIRGPARGILTAERTALNFLCHLSGVASATRGIVDAIAGTKAQVVCTRKTMPGLRAAQKYAVRVGGGSNHRFGLDDAVLIKDNHVAIAGGVRTAVERARAGVGHLVKIELEVDTLAQLQEAMALGGRCRAARQHGTRHAAPGGRDRGRPGDHRGLRPHPPRHRAGDRRLRGGSAVGGLADAQRDGAGYRAGSSGVNGAPGAGCALCRTLALHFRSFQPHLLLLVRVRRLSMRITSKGQVTIPVEIREQAGLMRNTEVDFEFDGKVVRIVPAASRTRNDRGGRLVAHLRGRGDVALTTDAIMALTRND